MDYAEDIRKRGLYTRVNYLMQNSRKEADEGLFYFRQSKRSVQEAERCVQDNPEDFKDNRKEMLNSIKKTKRHAKQQLRTVRKEFTGLKP